MSKYYIKTYYPDHPLANKDGVLLEHRLIAEEKLQRFLKKEECVYHINNNATDNNPDNLIIFKNNAHCRRYIKTGVLVEMKNGSCTSPRVKTFKICPRCGKEFGTFKKEKIFCTIKCCNLFNRKITCRPTKRELKNLIISNSMIKIGEMYNVSDNTIRDWCVCCGLPIKRADIVELRKNEETKKRNKVKDIVFDFDKIPITMQFNENKREFNNIKEAILYIQKAKLTSTNKDTIKKGIIRVITGGRKNYLKRIWTSDKYFEEKGRIQEVKSLIQRSKIKPTTEFIG